MMIFFLFSCKKRESNFIYDQTLAEFFSLELENNLFDSSKKIAKLDTINFYKFKDRIEMINYSKSNKILADFFEKNINYSEKLFFYGSKTIDKNTLYFLSFEDKYVEIPSRKIGFLALKNGENNKYTFIKVFKDEMESGDFLRSFFLNNYLLILRSNNESYDVVDESIIEPINEYYCVLKIEEDGRLILLKDKESEIILKSEFKLD
jgi:hypothetical protein